MCILILISCIVLLPTRAENTDKENINLDAVSGHFYSYIPPLGLILKLESMARVADDEILEEEQHIIDSEDFSKEQFIFENVTRKFINKTELRLNKTINNIKLIDSMIKNIDTRLTDADMKIKETLSNLNNPDPKPDTSGEQSGNANKRYLDWVKEIRLDKIDPIDEPPYVSNSFGFDPVLDKMFFKNPKPVDEEVDVNDYLKMRRNERMKRGDIRLPNERKRNLKISRQQPVKT